MRAQEQAGMCRSQVHGVCAIERACMPPPIHGGRHVRQVVLVRAFRHVRGMWEAGKAPRPYMRLYTASATPTDIPTTDLANRRLSARTHEGGFT